MQTHSTTRLRVSVNTDSGRALPLSFLSMPKAASTALEAIVRDNVKRLLKEHYQGKPGRISRLNENVSLSRIQEFLDGGGCHLASLQPWADALHVKPYHLLVKDLNIHDLPELVPAKRLRRLEKLRSELLEDEKSEAHSKRTESH